MKTTKESALLDIQGCAYDNCYQEVVGVVKVPFDILDLAGFNSRYYVNTPLCKKHYERVPADLYLWCKAEKKKTKGNSIIVYTKVDHDYLLFLMEIGDWENVQKIMRGNRLQEEEKKMKEDLR